MKTILFLLFFFNTIYGQEQVNKATYSFQMILENVSEQRKMSGEELNQFAEYAELNVYFDSNYSFYMLSGKLNNDDIYQEQFEMVPFMIGAFYPIFYNKKKNVFLYENALLKDEVILDDNVYKWVYEDETRMIDGYLCYKAVGKSKDYYTNDSEKFFTAEVWYCPELPYPFGPNMYQGLPGLVVLAIQNNEIAYKLEKIEFNVPEKLPLNILEAKTINVAEYHKFTKELFGE